MLKQLVRYQIRTADFGILLRISGIVGTFRAWSDADWARDHSKRRSRSGYVLQTTSSPVIWCSWLQSATAQSSSEAEYFALPIFVHSRYQGVQTFEKSWKFPMPNQLKSTRITSVLSPEQRRFKACARSSTLASSILLFGRLWSKAQAQCCILRLRKAVPTHSPRHWFGTPFAFIRNICVSFQVSITVLLEWACRRYNLSQFCLRHPYGKFGTWKKHCIYTESCFNCSFRNGTLCVIVHRHGISQRNGWESINSIWTLSRVNRSGHILFSFKTLLRFD